MLDIGVKHLQADAHILTHPGPRPTPACKALLGVRASAWEMVDVQGTRGQVAVSVRTHPRSVPRVWLPLAPFVASLPAGTTGRSLDHQLGHVPLSLHNNAVPDGRSAIADDAPPALEAVELAVAGCRAGVDRVRDTDLNFVVSRLGQNSPVRACERWPGSRQPRCIRRTRRPTLPRRGRSPRPESFAVRRVAPQ
jgi:hypothetical protein